MLLSASGVKILTCNNNASSIVSVTFTTIPFYLCSCPEVDRHVQRRPIAIRRLYNKRDRTPARDLKVQILDKPGCWFFVYSADVPGDEIHTRLPPQVTNTLSCACRQLRT